MHYIVLDLEWNQPFSRDHIKKKPVLLTGEIIQIGAVRLNPAFEPCDTIKIAVKPQYYTKMHYMVSKLTNIRSSDLKNGLPFPRAIERFREWCGVDFRILTWGWDDMKMLKDNLALHGLDDTWLPDDYNVQLIFDRQVTNEGRQVSLGQAVELMNIEPRDSHDALHDAYNTALICANLDMTEGLSVYSTLMTDYQELHASGKSIAPAKKYKSPAKVLEDPELKRFRCERCGENALLDKWVRQGTGRYIAKAKCSCGEEYFIRLRLRKKSEDAFYANIIQYRMNDSLRDYYQTQLEKNEEFRAAREQRTANRKKSVPTDGDITVPGDSDK